MTELLATIDAVHCARHDAFRYACDACREARKIAGYAADCPPDDRERCAECHAVLPAFTLDDAHFPGDSTFGYEYAECASCGTDVCRAITTVLRVKSHRASAKLRQLVGTDNVAEFYSWRDAHVFAVPSDRVAEALTIKGVSRARPRGEFHRCERRVPR